MYMAQDPRSRQGLNFDTLRRVVLLAVNARSSPEKDWDRRESPPGMLSLALAAPTITMDRYSQDTVAMMGLVVEQLRQKLAGTGNNSLKFFPISLSFDNLKDPKERHYFLNVPTSFFSQTRPWTGSAMWAENSCGNRRPTRNCSGIMKPARRPPSSEIQAPDLMDSGRNAGSAMGE